MNKEYINKIFKKLDHSYYRSGFSLKRKETEYLKRKGLTTIRKEAVEFINERIAPAQPPNDGRQTPMRNHPVFVAQHATATCCRKCIEKWHGIARGKELRKTEVEKLVDCVIHWIDIESTRNVRHRFLR